MASFAHILFLAAYATLAIFVALLVPAELPALGMGGAVAAGGFTFLAAALLHEMASRKSGHRGLVGAIMTVHHASNATADDLELARREINRLKHDLAETGKTTKVQIEAEMAAVKRLLGQLNDHLVKRGLANPTEGAPLSRISHRPESGAAASDFAAGFPGAAPAEVRSQTQPGAAAPISPVATPVDSPVAASVMPDGQVLALVREALEMNRFELYLQPVVTLPQRKTRFFEIYSRLRDHDGNIILPDRYVPMATQAGLITAIDSLMLYRCVQIIRKLKQRNRSRGFFCNLALDTLRDQVFFEQFFELLASDRTLPQHLVFEISARELDGADAEIGERFAQLARLGCSFSLDQLTSFNLNYEGLAERKFQYVKVDARKLAGEARDEEGAKTIIGLRDNLRSSGIDLIAEKIESEKMVVDLLEFDFDYGEGYLFGEPRPLREDF
jgi:cyclic-di-GMP phosphodiesterase TipF (flagellum assembly factor)